LSKCPRSNWEITRGIEILADVAGLPGVEAIILACLLTLLARLKI